MDAMEFRTVYVRDKHLAQVLWETVEQLWFPKYGLSPEVVAVGVLIDQDVIQNKI